MKWIGWITVLLVLACACATVEGVRRDLEEDIANKRLIVCSDDVEIEVGDEIETGWEIGNEGVVPADDYVAAEVKELSHGTICATFDLK